MCRNLRRAMFGAGVVAIASSVACEKPAPPAPPPPEVYVAAVVQKDVPVYLELVGQTAGLPGRRDPGARRGLPRDGELPGRHVRRARATCSTTIDRKPLEAIARAARRPTRRPPRRGSRRPTTTSRATRRSSPSRRSASRSSTTRVADAGRGAVAGRGRQGRRREGDARSGYTRVTVADRRAGRHDAGQGRATSSAAARARC